MSSFKDFQDDDILSTASANGVIPLLAVHLPVQNDFGFSTSLIEQIKDLSRALAVYDLLLNDSTQKTLELLALHEIPVLLLKGTPLAQLTYPSTYLRPRCDTDLYIDEADVAKTAAVLASPTWRRIENSWGRHS